MKTESTSIRPSHLGQAAGCRLFRVSLGVFLTNLAWFPPCASPAIRPDIVWMSGGHSSAFVIAMSDGMLATASGDGTLKLWRPEDGVLWRTYLLPTPQPVSLSLTPDSSLVGIGCATGMVSLVRTWDGAVMWQTNSGLSSLARLAFTPDGSFLAAGGNSPTGADFHVWHTMGGLADEPLNVGGSAVLAWTDDLSFLMDSASYVWRLDTRESWRRFAENAGVPAFSPDNAYLAARYYYYEWPHGSRYWTHCNRLADGGLMLRFMDAVARSLQFSPDATALLAGWDGSFAVYSVLNGSAIWSASAGTGPILAHYSPDGTRIVTGSQSDYSLRVWDAVNRSESWRSAQPPIGISGMAFSPDGEQLAIVGTNQTLLMLRTSDRRLLWDKRTRPLPPLAVAFSPHLPVMVTAEGTIPVWNATNGTLLYTLAGHATGVNALSFSPSESNLLASAGVDRSIKLWRVGPADGFWWKTLYGHTSNVTAVSFSPDGSLLASASADATVRLWRGDGTYVTNLIDCLGGVTALAFSPDGQFLAAAAAPPDPGIRVWHVSSRGLTSTITNTALSLAFSGSPNTLVTVNADQTVALWEIPSGDLLARYDDQTYQARVVACSPSGSLFAYGRGDATVVLARNPLHGFPKILQAPQAQMGVFGQSVTFSVNAAGYSPLSFQWRKDGVDIPGATNATLLLTNLQWTDAGAYCVLVTNLHGSMLSATGTLTVATSSLDIRLHAGLTVHGVVGQTYRIESKLGLEGESGWTPRATLTLSAPEQVWTDPKPATQPRSIYRAVLVE
jgi:WD40 repeat protein